MQQPQAQFNIMMCGLPGSEKSIVAAKFAKCYGLRVISTSDIKTALAGHHHSNMYNAVWNEVMNRAEAAAAEGKNVLFDSTNLEALRRITRLIDLRRAVPGPWILCEMQTTLDAACENLSHTPLGNEDVMSDILSQFESPTLHEGFERIVTLNQSGKIIRNLVRQAPDAKASADTLEMA